jgi:hypothetical protein
VTRRRCRPCQVQVRSAIGIRGAGVSLGSGTPSSALTLYVSRAATPLPLRATLVDTKDDSDTITFSDWGERVVLKAPTGAIPVRALESTSRPVTRSLFALKQQRGGCGGRFLRVAASVW